jgi:hypothetical protein
MSEVYPTDTELINMISEAETGVEFIPTGTAPYFLHFRKLLHRLLLSTKRANDLRLFDEGGLVYGVKPGKFWYQQAYVEYAGSSGNVFPDNTENIYVYLDNAGVLQTGTLAFPAMAGNIHVRLAIVSTSDGDITSITDCRDHHSISLPADRRVKITNYTISEEWGSDYYHYIDGNDSGNVHTNLGATDYVTICLPYPHQVGIKVTFAVQAAHELRIYPFDGSIIDDSGNYYERYKFCSDIGACITLVSLGDGDWITLSKHGNWQEQV